MKVKPLLTCALLLLAVGCAHPAATQAKLRWRPPVASPEEHLRPFVEFLQAESADPQVFLLRALASHRLVILGEVHHRPRYWALNSSLVRDPAFAERVGVIYMEMPSNDQCQVEKFLAAPEYDPQPILEMLRDIEDGAHMGWPDQAVLDFFKAVWQANQRLPEPQRLRVVLADAQRPWKAIRRRADWKKYRVDRNQFMAETVLRDLREHSADPRHALFIVGYGHAMINLTGPDRKPMKTAGWHLRQELGETNIFAVFPHSPVMANFGGVHGRIALGLFDTAFAALTNRPMAFPLDHGPFGEQVFDASMDDEDLTRDPFRKGFQAYLYLGPLEDEVFSPLIPGFFTDDFIKEVDRRFRLMAGKGLLEVGLQRLDEQTITEALKSGFFPHRWGQPRAEWSARNLGPLRAWEFGSDWKR